MINCGQRIYGNRFIDTGNLGNYRVHCLSHRQLPHMTLNCGPEKKEERGNPGFCEGKPAIVTTQAVTDITTVTVTRQSLRMCEANPAFGLDLASYVGDVLRLMCFDAENQSVSDVTTRLINFIFLYMKSEDYCQTQCIPMSYENLASAVNASRIQIAL